MVWYGTCADPHIYPMDTICALPRCLFVGRAVFSRKQFKLISIKKCLFVFGICVFNFRFRFLSLHSPRHTALARWSSLWSSKVFRICFWFFFLVFSFREKGTHAFSVKIAFKRNKIWLYNNARGCLSQHIQRIQSESVDPRDTIPDYGLLLLPFWYVDMAARSSAFFFSFLPFVCVSLFVFFPPFFFLYLVSMGFVFFLLGLDWKSRKSG